MKIVKLSLAGFVVILLAAAQAQHPRALPISFEENHGQAPADIRFLARGISYNLAFTPEGSRVSMSHAGKQISFAMTFKGANASAAVTGEERQTGKVHYFRGRESFINIPTFARVRYDGIYHGIDLVYYGNQQELEYDLAVQPGADPSAIALHFEGVNRLEIDSQGDLHLNVNDATLVQHKPVLYQFRNGLRKTIAGQYRLIAENTVGFDVGPFDRKSALIIDPILSYSTFVGGNGDDDARAVATDAAGNIYITGSTTSTNFPVVSSAQPKPGSQDPTADTSDAFVMKLNAAGTAVVSSTYLGGADDDVANGIAVDSAGNVTIAGWTASTDFPTTTGAVDRTCNVRQDGSCMDAFIARLNPAGSALVYSTYYGGGGDDQAHALAGDSAGNAYLTGTTASSDFPVTAGAYSTVATAGGFVAKLSPTGAVIYSSYFGAGQGTAEPNGIAVDAAGNAFITGASTSSTTTGTDVFVTKLNGSGTAAFYTQFIRGMKDDVGRAIAVDAAGSAYVTGKTQSVDFITTPGVVQPVFGGGPAFRSVDAGATWSASTVGLTRGSLYALAAAPSDPATIYAGADDETGGDVFRSDDGGNTWTAVSSGLTDARVHALAVDPSTESTVYAGTRNAGVFKSTTGGGVWNATGLKGGFVTALAVDPVNPSTVYAGTDSSGLYKSTDGGSTWTGPAGTLANSSIHSIVIDPVTDANVYAATSTGVYKSRDAGQTWVSANSGIFDENVNAVIINPKNPASLFAATDSFGIFRSLNGGTFWLPSNSGITSLTEGISVSALTIDANGVIYAAVGQSNASRIYRSANGINWTATGLASPRVSSLVANSSTNTVVAATVGGAEAFIAKWDATGRLVYSTYLGGYRDDGANAIAVDGSGNVVIAGFASSANFPVSNAIQPLFAGGSDEVTDAFAAKLNVSGAALLWSTYLGGSSDDGAKGVAMDSSGNVYVVGQTASADFPTPAGLVGSRPGLRNGFLAKISDSSSIVYRVPARGGMTATSQGMSLNLSAGYVRIQPVPGAVTPSGLAIFGFRENNTLVSEAAVPASALVSKGRIYAEVAGSVNTGIAMANPNPQDVTVTFNFTDAAGNDFGQGTTTILANGQIAAFLNQPPFNAPSPTVGTFSFVTSLPVSVIALRGLTNERNEFLITTLPVADTSVPPDAGVIVFPHFADGGGWTTQLLLVNTTDTVISGSIQFFGQGSSSTGGQLTATPSKYTLPPRSSFHLQTPGTSSSVTMGSVRVVPDAGSNSPSGVAVFAYRTGGVTVTVAGVPVTGVSSAFRLYAELSGISGQTGSIQTGVAVANPGQTPAVVTFELNTLSGASTGITGSTTVPGNGQIAVFLAQIPGFGAVSNPLQGVLRVATASASGIALTGIRGRYNERGDFLVTTTAPSNESRQITAEQFFPHFADGGGYTTQFILYNGSADQQATGTLKFFSQSGQPVSLALR